MRREVRRSRHLRLRFLALRRQPLVVEVGGLWWLIAFEMSEQLDNPRKRAFEDPAYQARLEAANEN